MNSKVVLVWHYIFNIYIFLIIKNVKEQYVYNSNPKKVYVHIYGPS